MSTDDGDDHAASFTNLEILGQVLDAVPDGMLIVDREGRVRLWNDEAHTLFGYAAGEIIGQPVETLIPLHLGERHRQHRVHYMQSPRRRPMGSGMELRARLRDGSEVPVEVSLSPVDIGGELYVIASIRDMGPRLRAEENLHRVQQQEALIALWELALSRASTLDACRAAVAYLGRELEAHRVRLYEIDPDAPSSRLHVVCDTAPQAVNNRSLPEHEELDIDALLHQAVDTPAQDNSSMTLGIYERGNTTVLLLSLQALGFCHGALLIQMPAGTRLDNDQSYLVRSVSHLLATTLASRQANRILLEAAKLDALGQLSGGIAHDFNNLLSVVSGNLELLEERVRSQALVRMLESTRRSVRRGAQLTQRLLLFARKQAPNVAPHRLQDDLPGLVDALKRLLGSRIDLELAIPADLPAVMLDPGILDACVINLSTNARDAMPEGGTLRIDARRIQPREAVPELSPGAYVALSVTDTGTGMSEAVRRRAFEPFFTTKGSQRGTGLGLGMIHMFMQQLGGGVSLNSRPGMGTDVHLYFRIAHGGEHPADHPQAMPFGRGQRILVVEDDEAVSETAGALVAELGYRPLLADSMQAALHCLEMYDDIAAVFTDVMLDRGGSGIQLARKVHARTSPVPVLLTSGYGHMADLLEHDEYFAGRLPLLAKPYTREQLARALYEAMAVSPPRGQ